MLHVLIDGDRIAAVTPTVPTDMAGVAVVHAEGRYLIPGLMDSHVHLTGIPAIPYPMRAQHPDLWRLTCGRCHDPSCGTGTRQSWT